MSTPTSPPPGPPPSGPPPSGAPPSGPPPSPPSSGPPSSGTDAENGSAAQEPSHRLAAVRAFLATTVWTRLRTALTLAVLAVILLVATRWALDAVDEPFPDATGSAPLCEDTDIAAGDVLRPAGMTVSVLNAGSRTGLGGTTLDGLQDQGFARGRLGNAEDAEDDRPVRVRTAQLWTSETTSPAVRLLSTYLGGDVTVVDRDSPVEGLTLVVGDQFPGVREGRAELTVKQDSTVCAPVALQ